MDCAIFEAFKFLIFLQYIFEVEAILSNIWTVYQPDSVLKQTFSI